MSDKLVKIIKKEFLRKSKINPKFSLRAYAKYLDISPATLSLIMSDKTVITPRVFGKIKEKINLSADVLADYDKKIAQTKLNRSIRQIDHTEEMRQLEMSEFSFISDWYYYAILEIFNLDKYSDEPKWIADKLGIKEVKKITIALERLIELGLLARDQSGKLFLSNSFTSILDYTISSKGMKMRQQQIMQLSSQKIEVVPIEKRDNSGITVCIDPELLPEIKNKIKVFRRTLGNFIVKNSKKNKAIYELQINFIPLVETDS